MTGSHGPFELLAELGEGTFANVYRARDVRSGRLIALKVLKAEFCTSAEISERFRREAVTASAISSPHVVQIYESGVIGDKPYIAMELVEGKSLRDFIDGTPFSADEVRVIIGQVMAALAAAHRKQIVHRDLKPENIMLVGDNAQRQVKVLDFGFAKMADLEVGKDPLTQAGLTFGTPAYMSPEQIQGQRADRAVDLYAAGVIAYELLAGKLPWTAVEPRDVFLEVLMTPPPVITALHPSVVHRDRVNHFLQRALAKTRNQRPPDSETFFSELEAALLDKAPAKAAPVKSAAFDSILGKTISLKPVMLDSDEFNEAPPFESDVVEEPPVPTPPAAARPASAVDGSAAALASVTGSGTHATTATLPRVAAPRPSTGPRPLVVLVIVLVVVAAVAATAVGYYVGSR